MKRLLTYLLTYLLPYNCFQIIGTFRNYVIYVARPSFDYILINSCYFSLCKLDSYFTQRKGKRESYI